MTGFQKIEKAMNDAKVQYTDARYYVSTDKASIRKDIGYTSIACSVYDHESESDARIIFIHVSKWSDGQKYRVALKTTDAEYEYKMHTADDVAAAVSMTIRMATL